MTSTCVVTVAFNLSTCSGADMATAAEFLRRQVLQRAVYARFKSALGDRSAAVLQDNAWLLATHAVDAIMEAQATAAAGGRTPAPNSEPAP